MLDAGSGMPVEDAQLLWRTVTPAGTTSSIHAAQLDADSGRFEILAPMGELLLSARGPSLRQDWVPATVPPGAGRFTLECQRQYEVCLVLKHGQQHVPLPGGLAAVTWEHLEGDGRPVAFGRNALGDFVALDQPGRYRVLIDTPAGFQPIPEQVLELGGTQPVRHRIPLSKP